MKVEICKNCNSKEYYDCMVWYNGKTYCRRCTYERWEKETNHKWKPSENDYVFPKYKDGKIY